MTCFVYFVILLCVRLLEFGSQLLKVIDNTFDVKEFDKLVINKNIIELNKRGLQESSVTAFFDSGLHFPGVELFLKAAKYHTNEFIQEVLKKCILTEGRSKLIGSILTVKK